MAFLDMIKRGKTMEKAFDDLDEDMLHALDESMVKLDDAVASAKMLDEEGVDLDDVDVDMAQEDAAADSAVELTSHTRARIAALEAFEKVYENSQVHLQDIGARLTKVTTYHHSVAEIISILHNEIHRANELEIANVAVLKEHRKLFEEFQDQSRKHQERENFLEHLHQRETGLAQDNETLRAMLASAKLELVEATNTLAKNDSEFGELNKALSARTADAERRARENETLRDKYVQLSLELDKAMKKEAEARHKFEEATQVHSNDTMRNNELLNMLAASEKETMRLQKALDFAQMKQSELAENARIMEADREAENARSNAEIRGLRTELQSMQSRLEAATQMDTETASELADLKMRLDDAMTEKHVVDERLTALILENDANKSGLLSANANLSEMSLKRASEQIELDIRVQECEDLRLEVAALSKQVKELLPYERLHRVTAARQREASSVVDFASVVTDPARPPRRRPNGSGRTHAV